MKKNNKTFELVPSIQTRKDKPAPMAFIPALPVRLERNSELAQYAIVDTSAEVSIMPASIAHDLGLDREIGRNKITIKGIYGKYSCDLIKATLIICDSDFTPWLRLENVPFALLPDSNDFLRSNRLILGFDSCLSILQLKIDNPRRTIDISAPVRFLASNIPGIQDVMPSRITEAEREIKIGSFNSAIFLIVVELEEVILSSLSTIPERYTLGGLIKLLAQEGLTLKHQKQLEIISKIRNRVAHPDKSEPITKGEAIKVLRYAKDMIRQISSLKSIQEIIKKGESESIEFKSSLRWDYKEARKNKKHEYNIAKVITAFLNSTGGTLLIGVGDNGEILGLDNDIFTLKKQNVDGFELELFALIRNYIGEDFLKNIHITFETINDKFICRVIVSPSQKPAFVDNKEFYVRTGNSSQLLEIQEAKEYINTNLNK